MTTKPRGTSFRVPPEWTFKTPTAAAAFDAHVREQLPWYSLATGAVAHVARCFIPDLGTVIDVGASTGNIGRALETTLKARRADLIALDSSDAMRKIYDGPGCFKVEDVVTYDFWKPQPDVVICFLSLMFVPVRHREGVITRMRQALRPGGAIIIVDKIVPRGGYVGTVNYRMTLAAKYEAGATPQEIIRKELSIAGLQRPLVESELDGFCEFFRFGDFAGYVWEKLSV
jgi:tRNA (cmo5U34)-methyltransferase